MSKPVSYYVNRAKAHTHTTVEHVKKHPFPYVFLAGGLTGEYFMYKYGPRRPVSAEAIQYLKQTGVDEWITGAYKNGFYPLLLDKSQHTLYLSALVQAGRISQEMAKDCMDSAEWTMDQILKKSG